MRLWERICEDSSDFGRGGFASLWSRFMRIHETLGEDSQGFVRIHETLGEDS